MSPITKRCVLNLIVLIICSAHTQSINAVEPGLIFRLSGERSDFTADTSGGDPVPGFLKGIETVSDGVTGNAIRVSDTSGGGITDVNYLMGYYAPGNIYAERGTLSFFWRARTPLGPTPFKIFQAAFSEHNTIDMTWLRIDWNGRGFDAFVTDLNLARVRVSHAVDTPPAPDAWTHIAFTWDETSGVRLYIDGAPVARRDTTATFNAGLSMFAPHGRFFSSQIAVSNFNHGRTGDFDEIRIYDRMLDDDAITRLATGGDAGCGPYPARSLDDPSVKAAWYYRYGWDDSDSHPPVLDAPSTRIRQVGINEVHDLKQWVWKANDGIRETTWPNVYNRSHLPGRSDYFIEPDWNCYSLSGKEVTFTMPDEAWNYLEITGAGYGTFDFSGLDDDGRKGPEARLFQRPRGRERTFHHLETDRTCGGIRFTNVVQETSLGEFSAFHVSPGREPRGISTLSYRVRADAEPYYPCLDELRTYISGRYLPDQRTTVVALPGGAPVRTRTTVHESGLPFVTVLVPCDFRLKEHRRTYGYGGFSYTWQNMYDGLDGVALDIPALDLPSTHNGLIPLNIQVGDPLWPGRSLMDVSVAVRPGEARTVWLDTRNRILPGDRSMSLTLACAAVGFGPLSIDGMNIRLVFTERDKAISEHEIDRFTQVRDNALHFEEGSTNLKDFGLYERFDRDISDLFRVDPDNRLARFIWLRRNGEQGWPPFRQADPPPGVPLWAFRQIEDLRLVEEFINWWIDNRQIENGEFGGGLSDDCDFTTQWPGAALMGIQPQKLTASLNRLMDAYYEQGLFTNGLSTIKADELHSHEEGINVIPGTMLLNYGDPKAVERLMATAKAYSFMSGINDRGERQIKSNFFSGSDLSLDQPWGRSKTYGSYLVLHAGTSLVEFNGHPATRKIILELADGLLAHRKIADDGFGYLPSEIVFPSGESYGRAGGAGMYNHFLWAAWNWTGDERYLANIRDELGREHLDILGTLTANITDILDLRDELRPLVIGRTDPWSGSHFLRHLAWQLTGDIRYIEEIYGEQIAHKTQNMYNVTEHQWWVDHVYAPSLELQRERLGGIAYWIRKTYPGHLVSWRFHEPATWEDLAVLIPEGDGESFKVLAFNLSSTPVNVDMTGWMVEPGTWELTRGLDTTGDNAADTGIEKHRVTFERSRSLELTFPAKKTTILTMRRIQKGTPYHERPDLGIGLDDIVVDGGTVRVTVHSLGSVATPPSTLSLVTPEGTVATSVDIGSLDPPLDYEPRTVDLVVEVPAGTDPSGLSVVIDHAEQLEEITRMNNTVTFSSVR